MSERLYKLTEKGKKLLEQLKYNEEKEHVNMVSMVESILMINHENKSSHNSSKDEKGRS
jgi:DNA-binding PadR family transcriptional regulator